MRIKPITYLVTWHQPSPNGIISSVYYIRTEIKDLQPDVAAELVGIIHGANPEGLPEVLMSTTPIIDREVECSCTIRAILERPEGNYMYYRRPGQTTPITIIRTSDEGEPYTDVVRVPACVAENDTNGTRARELFKQIMLEFAEETTPVDHLTPQHFMDARRNIWSDAKDNELPDVSMTTWNDVFKLPEDFLKRYHVSIKPIDNALTMELNMDEGMFTDDEAGEFGESEDNN